MQHTAGGKESLVPPRDSPALLRLAGILVEWRWFIGLFTLCLVVLAVIFSLIVPSEYEAEVVIYPHSDSGDLMGGATGALASIQSLLGETTPGSNADVIKAVLDTRDLARVTLVTLGEIPAAEPTPEQARAVEMAIGRQRGSVEVSQLDTGAMRIRVKAKTPELAVRTANLYVSLADSIIREKTRQSAAATRTFLERRIIESHRELGEAQTRLRVFQQDSNAVNLEAQADALLRVGSDLEVEILRLDAEIETKGRYLTDRNPEMQKLMQQRDALRTGAMHLSEESAPDDPPASSWSQRNETLRTREMFPPIRSLPSLGARYANLFLTVEVQKQVLVYLNSRLEQAKLEESRSVPTLQVLDPAAKPPWRASPRRKLIVATSLVMGILGGSILSVIFQLTGERLGQEDRASIRRMLDALGWNRWTRRGAA